jgi:glutamate-ammonia-ligase adenylyltransferase
VSATGVLYADVLKMRGRMRTELDRSDAARLDLKQGAGGVVDLEFLLQTGVLARSARHGVAAAARYAVVDRCVGGAGFLPDATAQALHGAHATLLDVGLACTLDRRPRLAPTTPAIEEACSDCGGVQSGRAAVRLSAGWRRTAVGRCQPWLA